MQPRFLALIKRISLIIGVCTFTAVGGCNSQDTTEKPKEKAKLISVINEPLSNQELLECRKKTESAAPEYSISPNGKYLVTVDRERYDPPYGRYVKDNVSYAGLKILIVWKITGNKKLPKTFHTLISVASGKNIIGYAWGSDNFLYYKGLNYTEGRPYLTGYDPENDVEFTFKKDVDGVFDKERGDFEKFKRVFTTLEGQISFNKNRLNGFSFGFGETDWRPNAFGEVTIGLEHNKETGFKTVKFSSTPQMKPYQTFLKDYRRNTAPREQHPSRAGWTYNPTAPIFDEMNIYPSNHFRTSENREYSSLLEDKNISHLHYLSNVDRNYISLLRYDDAEKTRGHSQVFSPSADITHVSFNRDGSKPYWAITEEGFPKYKIFNETSKLLFDLIKITEPHKSEVLSIDENERMVVVKRVSPQRGYEYLLVDTVAEESVLLESCPGKNKMPWANLSELQFTASDGQTVWGYAYRPIKQANALPTIIYAHGGPSAREYVSSDNIYIKSLVERGYAVVVVNYRGSIGYGRDFRETGWKNFSRSRSDLIEAARAVIKSNIADPTKVAIMGNSYGGFLSLSMTLENNTPFKAVVSRNGISDLVGFLETEFVKSNGRTQKYNEESHTFGNVKNPSNREVLLSNSVLHNTGTISLPIYLAHAVNDNRVPIGQSKKLYDALLMRRPDIMIQYQELPGGHAISDLGTLEEYIDGVDRFLKKVFEE